MQFLKISPFLMFFWLSWLSDKEHPSDPHQEQGSVTPANLPLGRRLHPGLGRLDGSGDSAHAWRGKGTVMAGTEAGAAWRHRRHRDHADVLDLKAAEVDFFKNRLPFWPCTHLCVFVCPNFTKWSTPVRDGFIVKIYQPGTCEESCHLPGAYCSSSY